MIPILSIREVVFTQIRSRHDDLVIDTIQRSGPNSEIRGVIREAVEGFGVSLVPRRASVRKDTLRPGLC